MVAEPALTRERLNAKIAEVAELDPDPAKIAEKVLADLTAAEKRAVAALTLTGYVRHRIGEAHRHLPAGFEGKPAPRTGTKIYRGADGTKYASARARHFAEWQAILGASIGGPDGRKFFGEFTVQEVRWLATYRNRQAQQLAAQADRYERIAVAMQKTNAERVQDLSPEIGLPIMRDLPQE